MKDQDHSHRVDFLVIGLIAVTAVNKMFLFLLGEPSPWRAEHSLTGLILLMAFAALLLGETHQPKRLRHFFLAALIPDYLGTLFPDIDITLFGIGGHRNPLFHSSLSYWLLVVMLGGRGRIARYIVIGYGIGLCSHLFMDAFDRAPIRWLPGGLLVDRAWLVANGLLCLVFPPAPGTQPILTGNETQSLAGTEERLLHRQGC